ncbi:MULTISPECIES: lysozyme inhibitor LprI family protein [Clostridium]|uniref:Lysozyme inhibitor LprI-like N-terminal domain-containing protein n=1 Tax=Clostridium nitritogenes TaxID=83340 RepID=A0ABP3X1V3_9CLOT|nr:lysozyme inhibitor LprI family protein [Clostridium baratii]MBT9831962.1 DUF1311 domain-containing protein [Clostridium baratii]STA99868.1 putative lipoprotein [Clostridium baratii]
MKKKHIIITLIVIIIIIAACIIGFYVYRNSAINKQIEKADSLVNDSEYDKALAQYELILDNDSDNKKAKEAKEMLEEYLHAKKLYDEGKLDEAKESIEKINKSYESYNNFKDNIEGLREKINEGLKTNKDIDSSISKARDLIENKKYEEAKKVLDKINSSDLKENQKQTIDDLKGRVDSEIKNKEQSKKESLATERIKFLNELNDIQKDINEMPAGDTTAEMHEFADNEYKLWDNALNKIYRYLKNNLPQDKFKALEQDEVRWIKEKEAKAKDAADKFKGGTAEPVVYLGALADETKDRCYKLVNEYMN